MNLDIECNCKGAPILFAAVWHRTIFFSFVLVVFIAFLWVYPLCSNKEKVKMFDFVVEMSKWDESHKNSIFVFEYLHIFRAFQLSDFSSRDDDLVCMVYNVRLFILCYAFHFFNDVFYQEILTSLQILEKIEKLMFQKMSKIYKNGEWKMHTNRMIRIV